eukprot:3616891-Pleurochrysis_carterae.AAC.1
MPEQLPDIFSRAKVSMSDSTSGAAMIGIRRSQVRHPVRAGELQLDAVTLGLSAGMQGKLQSHIAHGVAGEGEGCNEMDRVCGVGKGRVSAMERRRLHVPSGRQDEKEGREGIDGAGAANAGVGNRLEFGRGEEVDRSPELGGAQGNTRLEQAGARREACREGEEEDGDERCGRGGDPPQG